MELRERDARGCEPNATRELRRFTRATAPHLWAASGVLPHSTIRIVRHRQECSVVDSVDRLVDAADQSRG
ncbi:hypothetical protein HSB1_35310 [Halogranum salarium B-1]|uniref:Uncharacterized protein n=1 Tax=Halogranum salarium B-1 TaxID=1210908 RepID=J3JE75_9EURY|nr:hypothetical protein HSB1_35310 [Halogranum salarium B-1]